MKSFTLEQIARVAHAAHLMYCRTIGDHTQLPWESTPEYQREATYNGVRAMIDILSAGETLDPRQAHEGWMEEMLHKGWKYGKVKDYTIKSHPNLVPYDELPDAQKVKDALFANIVATFFRFDKYQ